VSAGMQVLFTSQLSMKLIYFDLMAFEVHACHVICWRVAVPSEAVLKCI